MRDAKLPPIRTSTWIIADDHAIVRAGMIAQLAHVGWLKLIGEASDGEAALRLIADAHPELALLDLRMPARSGIEVVTAAKEAGLRTRIVLVSAFNDPVLVRKALDAGAWAFVDKASTHQVMVDALRSVRDGKRYVDPALASAMLVRGAPELSEREQEVLQLIADGMSNGDIAEHLEVTIETVKTYVRRVLTKLEADSRTDAVAQGLRRAIIE